MPRSEQPPAAAAEADEAAPAEAEAAASSTSATDAADAPLSLAANDPVLYTQADGTVVPAKVAAVHHGSAEDPEPFYTIRLEDGSERETVAPRSRQSA